jgi:uncharacterized protein (TIGR02145 family)
MNSLAYKKIELRSVLPNKGINRTIESLEGIILKESEKFKTLIIIKADFKEQRKRQQRGVVSSESFILKENQLREKLLDFIDDLEWHETTFSVYTDSRDGQKYRTLNLSGKIWFAENLNFDAGAGCSLFNNDPRIGKKYGRLYNWEAAHKACPTEWRLPTNEEWHELIFGNSHPEVQLAGYREPKRKSSSGSDFDDIVFDPSTGELHCYKGRFIDLGICGRYWSVQNTDSDEAWYYHTIENRGSKLRKCYDKRYRYSCICVKSL